MRTSSYAFATASSCLALLTACGGSPAAPSISELSDSHADARAPGETSGFEATTTSGSDTVSSAENGLRYRGGRGAPMLPNLDPPRQLPRGVVSIRPSVAPAMQIDKLPIFNVTLSGPTLYFSDGAGQLWSAPKDGSAEPSVLARDRVGNFIVSDADVTYASRNAISRVGTAGGTARLLVPEPDDPVFLVSDGRDLFWTTFDGTGVRSAPIAGGPASIFMANVRHGIIEVDDAALYVVDYGGGNVTRVTKRGNRAGATQLLASKQPKPVGIALDQDHVYYPCEADGSLRRVSKNGGAIVTLATDQVNHDVPVVDATHVYWTTWRDDPGGHALMRVTKDGSRPPELLLAGLHEPTNVAVDETHVWVVNKGEGEILRLKK